MGTGGTFGVLQHQKQRKRNKSGANLFGKKFQIDVFCMVYGCLPLLMAYSLIGFMVG